MDSTHIYIIPLNLSEFPKIGKFGIIFDTIPCEIDDLAVSSRHSQVKIFYSKVLYGVCMSNVVTSQPKGR